MHKTAWLSFREANVICTEFKVSNCTNSIGTPREVSSLKEARVLNEESEPISACCFAKLLNFAQLLFQLLVSGCTVAPFAHEFAKNKFKSSKNVYRLAKRPSKA